MILSVDSVHGILKIGSPPKKLPGILESVEVGGSLHMETLSAQGRSGSSRKVHGWSDADIAFTLILIDDPGGKKTRFDSLAEIASIFKTLSSDGGPEVFALQHPMTDAWKVKQLLFSQLRSSENRGKQKIRVSLEFVEHNPVVGTSQDRKESSGAAESTTAEEPAVSGAQEKQLREVEERIAGY